MLSPGISKDEKEWKLLSALLCFCLGVFPPSDRLMVFIQLLTPVPRSRLGPKGWAFPVRQQGRLQKSTGPACKSGRNEDPSLSPWTPPAGPARACEARLGCRLPGGLFLKDVSAGGTHSF